MKDRAPKALADRPSKRSPKAFTGGKAAANARDLSSGANPSVSETQGAAVVAARAQAAGLRAAKLAAAVRSFFGVLLIVSVTGGLVASLRHYVRTSPRFALGQVDVTGGKRFETDELLAIGGVARGQNVFLIDLEGARAHLLANPWLSDAKLARDLPNTLRIDVKERSAAALVALGDTFVAARNGEIFKKIEPGDPTDLPIITGLDATGLTDDRAGLEKRVEKALDLAADYDALALGKHEPLQQIHCKNDGSISLFVGKNAIELVLGRAPYRRKLEEASRIFEELKRLHAKADSVLLDNDARPDRVVVRMR